MGKGTDKLYITHSEWNSSDAYGASSGANVSVKDRSPHAFRRLPFNFCAASLQPFKNPVCTSDGTIFDVEVISSWFGKHKTNPVNGDPLSAKDLIRLDFARNGEAGEGGDGGGGGGDLIDPVTFKVFTDNTHIVAVRHGNYANVFAWETVERMNVKAKMWRDLVDDAEFKRSDIITLQDPHNIERRNLSRFKYLQDGGEALLTKEQEEERQSGSVNIDALGRMGDKVLRAKSAVAKARKEREAGGDVNRSAVVAKSSSSQVPVAASAAATRQTSDGKKAAIFTTGRAAASFTSTGLTPETSGERALLTDEEYLLKPKRVKNKGYARIETNHGDLTIELHTDVAPRAVWNFTKLAQKRYYQGVAFHRNIPGFMIQGGDPDGTGRGGRSIWGKYFEDEVDGPLTHDARGVLSMANKGKNTNSSQFFITYDAVPHLDRKHTIFGRVISGTDVLRKMEAVPTDGSDRPLNKIVMKQVVVFVDPFEEFQKQQRDREKVQEEKMAIQRRGGTDDDRTTWTGKRIRGDGGTGTGSDEKVGKYFPAAATTAAGGEGGDDGGGSQLPDGDVLVDTWEEPAKKKAKVGGGGRFGNFDNW